MLTAIFRLPARGGYDNSFLIMPADSAVDSSPRPADAVFDQMVGQERAIAYLRQSHEAGRLPQAILFDGPPGIGKTSMAFALAKRLLAGGETDAESFARHARKVAADPMIHPDLKILAPSGAAGQIRVNDVREAMDSAAQMPIESTRKVFLIDPADRLNPASANSLLKLIEEPPPHLAILMTTESAHSVLPTIQSRSSRLRLHPVPEESMIEWLQGRGVESDLARAAAVFSGGSPGRALELLDGQTLVDRDALVEEWRFFQEHGMRGLFRVALNISNIGQPIESILAAWIAWTRDAWIASMSPQRPDLLVNRDREEDLAEEGRRMGSDALGRCMELLLEARAEISPIMNKQFYFERLLSRLGPILREVEARGDTK